MKLRSLLILALFCILSSWGFVKDNEPLKKLLAQLEKFRTEFPQEKVHLHFDKPYYAIGDTIWFKAYVLNAEHNQLSALSKILYVELINDRDSIKQSVRIPLEDGLAAGDFTLKDSLQEGNYRIRAYTTWMRNFGEEYFFDKTISIGNSISNNVVTNATYSFSKIGVSEKVNSQIKFTDLEGKPIANKEVNYLVQLDFRNLTKGKGTTDKNGILNFSFLNNQPFILKSGKIFTNLKLDSNTIISKAIPIKSTSDNIDVQFFPESGNLINGIRSKVAFKAVSADGLGAEVSGVIKDKDNQLITQFTTEHAGMGAFYLRPDKGNVYKAQVKFKDGSEKEIDLPLANNDGFVLSINSTRSDSLLLKIAGTAGLEQEDLTVVAQANGVVKYVSQSKSNGKLLTALIDKSRFESGVVQFTLFNSRNEPLAERLVFVTQPDTLSISIKSPEQSHYRDKVSLGISVKDKNGNPVLGSFSMAVIDESRVPFDWNNERTIYSDILLSSELKGFIEQPNYYFHNVTPEKVNQLDNLLLTQGWRRFVWKNIIANVFPTMIYKPEQNIVISGKISSPNGRPIVGGKVILFSSIGDVYLKDTLTNSEGKFVFNRLDFSDSTRFVIQARDLKGRKNVEIDLDVIPQQIVTKNKNAAEVEVNVNSSIKPYLATSLDHFNELRKYGLLNKTILLAEVKVVEKKPAVKYSSNLNGPGNADYVITAKDLQYTNNLIQYIQGRVAGLIIRNGILYSLRSMSSSFSGPRPVQIVMDGMFVEPQFIYSVNPRDVETIEILKSGSNTAIYGLNGIGGVLIITTKKGQQNLSYRSYSPGIISYNPQGLYKAKEFYSPNYDDPAINAKIADLRTTIFWEPFVTTDKTGNATATYFNADLPANYRVIIEGVSPNGELGRAVYRYQVR
ncbi:MAG: TonB-dependent receptor plug domain-containing protein [Daejeonella sp.]